MPGTGQPDAALALLDPIRDAHGAHPAWLELTARARMAAGRPAAAIRPLETLLAHQPSDPQAHWLLGSALLAAERHADAVPHLVAASEAHPKSPAVLNSLAYARYRAGDPQAEADARRALQLAPDHPHVQDTLGTLLLDQGAAEEAVGLLEQAHRGRPDAAPVRYRYAEALARTERHEEARRHLVSILENNDTPPETRARARTLLDDLPP